MRTACSEFCFLKHGSMLRKGAIHKGRVAICAPLVLGRTNRGASQWVRHLVACGLSALGGAVLLLVWLLCE